MVSALLKAIVIFFFCAGLLYCANLAFQGDLEMENILRDIDIATAYIKSLL